MRDPRPRSELPSATEAFERMIDNADGRRPVVFLDYDGVLTPIVSHPDLALIPEATRAVVEDLAELTEVAVISGRDTADVMSKVGVDAAWYAGSHGFDIVGPDGSPPEDAALDRFDQYVPLLIEAADRIEDQITDLPGVHVERKRFAVAVHFREAADDAEPIVERIVRAIGDQDERLRVTTGKKIFELRPAVEWDKGRALRWLMDQLGIDPTTSLPFYLGDDVTDEDAFAVLDDGGVGIVVGLDGEPTRASFSLDDPEDVRAFLSRLATALRP